MSIASKARKKAGTSANRPEYRAGFLRDAHRLIARGYARMVPSLLSKTVEVVVTEKLVDAINAAIEAPGAPSWMQRYHVQDDVRVRHPKKSGNRRPIVDIAITNIRPGPRPQIHFEAKRLGMRYTVGQYVGRKGLGCIIAADYAREHADAGMLGYVQSETCDAWAQKIEKTLSKNRTRHYLVGCSVWERSGLTPELTHVFLTQHNRPSLGRPVNVYHALLLFH